MKYEKAYDVQQIMKKIVNALNMESIDANRIVCMRSYGSKSRAIARIWSFPKIFQKALDCSSYYVIEVISERFDKLNEDEKEKTIIHELMHIPKSFSGGLLPHKHHSQKITRETVDKLYLKYKMKSL
ncbi:MAG: putative metallopeptidase [Candidatus Aenigmatarchaeota archaeon]